MVTSNRFEILADADESGEDYEVKVTKSKQKLVKDILENNTRFQANVLFNYSRPSLVKKIESLAE